MFHFNDRTYQILHVHKDAWNAEAFRERYSDVLDRYDYIVGDWGYSQLRLKGFFKEASPKANRDSTIAHLQDYLNEYCNFGCAYFILERVPNPNRAVEPVVSSPGLTEEETPLDGALTKAPYLGASRETLRTERPEHRDNRHRYDQSLHRAKQEAMKQAESSHQQNGSEKREQHARSGPAHRQESVQRKDQHARQHGNGGGHANRGANGHRSEHNARNDSRNDSRSDARNDSRNDSRNEQGGAADNRNRGRDRRPRGGGPRSDKPIEKQAGEHKPRGNHPPRNQQAHGQGRSNPANKSQTQNQTQNQTKDKAPISQ